MTEIPEHLRRRAMWARKAAQAKASGSVTAPLHTDLSHDVELAGRRTDEQWKLAEGYKRMQGQRFRRYGPIVVAVLAIAIFAALTLLIGSPGGHEPDMHTCYTSSDIVIRSTDCNQVEIHLQREIGHA